ncbi:hypothetical protein SORBI_3008G040501 [Sorghum bicolor]|uniref:Uncharacterized protein n=1 Tax=Sorghum bicolor TaxID=4558 RepID=A0A1Z5R4N3_SORBI|nr:hypothetical protein SORBI_3008G040501 [Sorghum bicolor]
MCSITHFFFFELTYAVRSHALRQTLRLTNITSISSNNQIRPCNRRWQEDVSSTSAEDHNQVL